MLVINSHALPLNMSFMLWWIDSIVNAFTWVFPTSTRAQNINNTARILPYEVCMKIGHLTQKIINLDTMVWKIFNFIVTQKVLKGAHLSLTFWVCETYYLNCINIMNHAHDHMGQGVRDLMYLHIRSPQSHRPIRLLVLHCLGAGEFSCGKPHPLMNKVICAHNFSANIQYLHEKEYCRSVII